MLKEFKEFAMKGNVLDMAIGVIIGAAFGKIVTSLVSDVLMPPIGLLMGRRFLQPLSQSVEHTSALTRSGQGGGNSDDQLRCVSANGVRFHHHRVRDFHAGETINRLKKPAAPAAPTTKDCPLCLSTIPVKATKCIARLRYEVDREGQDHGRLE